MKYAAGLMIAAMGVLAAVPDLNELRRMIARFAPVEPKVDVSKLSDGDRKALVKLVQAARAVESLFLTQFWGGPQRYEAQRGHPRLRMRHFPFSIGEPERDAWLKHMRAAVDEVGIPEPARAEMLGYFDRVAHFLINREPGSEAEK